MPTSVRGNRVSGFTLIELVVVLAIIAVAAALITFTIRDPAQTHLDREAARLVALLETARTEARAGGWNVVWVPGTDAQGRQFRFVGLPKGIELPERWLDPRVGAQVVGATSLVLGPDAILPPQRVVLQLEDKRLEVGTDGLASFAIVEAPATP